MSLVHRPEIDGLRAIAVLSVILFHAKASSFSGGYVGVDVFFVISGYLICRIIVTEAEASRFSFFGFFERRARRILPALLLVCLACVPAALIVLPPHAFDQFGKDLIAVMLFVSNFRFWQESDYFSESADLNPLIHAWSLSVEEQYYLFFPLLVLVLLRSGRRALVLSLVIIGAASLALAELISVSHPATNFYLLPTRVWEFFAGALCVFVRPPAGRLLRELIGSAGLAAILASVFLFTDQTPFPSLLAVWPVFGAAALIIGAGADTIVGRLLSARPLTAIGLISYSAYLWHQPLLAFARARGLAHEFDAVAAAAVALTFALAYLSWRFCEQPARRFRPSDRAGAIRRLVALLLCCVVLVLVGRGLREAREGQEALYLAALSDDHRRMHAFLSQHQGYDTVSSMVDDGACVFWRPAPDDGFLERFRTCAAIHGAPSFVVLGDSHAMNLYNALARTGRYRFLVGVAQGGCRPHDARPGCPYEDMLALAEAGDLNGARVMFHQSGSYFIADESGRVDSDQAFRDGEETRTVSAHVEQTEAYLAALSRDAEVLWAGPFTEARVTFGPWITNEELRFNPNALRLFSALDAELSARHRAAAPGYGYVSLTSILAALEPDLLHGDCLIVRDQDHFSRCGEALVGELLANSPAFASVE